VNPLFAGLCTAFVVLWAPAVAAQGKFIKENQVTEEAMIKALRPAAAEEPETEPMKTRSIKVTPHEPARPKQAAKADSKGGSTGGSTGASGGGSAPVLLTFETNSTELTGRAKKALDIIARSLTNAELINLKFAIEGHADSRGKVDENLALSKARAESVKGYLVNEHKVAEDRLQARGKGATELVIPKNPAAPENRRVTFVTLK
jgi:OmpA-OmpF porin, OOP family